MKLTRSLAFRLLTGIFFFMVAGVALLTFFLVNFQAHRYTNYSINTASLIGDVIKRSTDYSMLLNRREDIYHSIKTMGSEPGIEGIRIYNKKGVISFSSHDSEIGKTVDLNAEACIACHDIGKLDVSPNSNSGLTRIFTSPKGYRLVGVITPIKNEERCSSAECHAHSPSQTVLGVLDVMIPLEETDRNLAELRLNQYFGGIALIFVVTLFTGIFLSSMVTLPVRKLTEGTEEIIKGNLDHRIRETTKDEIGTLTRSFNIMTSELQQTHNELKELNQHLEQRVAEKTEALRNAQANMIQVEKMVSLGTLAATVAHELNNPLEGILTYSKVIKRQMEKLSADEVQKKEIAEELSMIATESSRCGNIVKNLLLFSRRRVGELREHKISHLIAQTLKLMDHHFTMHNIVVSIQYVDDIPLIICDGQQIEQTLLALELNAVEAMNSGGTMNISTSLTAENQIAINIQDSGYGIHEKDIPHIFEPFFTTKKEGKGTGLGLAVVYGIVQRHGGTISVKSIPLQGTTFTIILPIRPPVELEQFI